LLETALITEEIAAACPGLATSIFDSSLGMEPIVLSTNETARKKYLPPIAKDFKLCAFATSEPAMGLQDGRASGIRPCGGNRDDNRSAGPGARRRSRHGDLRAHPR
jgi:acyl-CoA dehydrogenase